MSNLGRVFCFLGAVALMAGAVILPHVRAVLSDGNAHRLIFLAVLCFCGAVAAFTALVFEGRER